MARSIVLVLLCSVWVWAVELPPPQPWAWQAPIAMSSSPGGEVAVGSGAGMPTNAFLSCIDVGGDTVFANLRLPAAEEQSVLAVASGPGVVIALLEQKTYAPPFSNALMAACVGVDRQVRWIDTLLTSDEFAVPWFKPQLQLVSSQLLVTWREPGTNGGAVWAQWLDAVTGAPVGVPTVAVPQLVYEYAVCVYETTAAIAAGNTLALLSTDHEVVTLDLQRAYGAVAVSRSETRTTVVGVSAGVVCGEVISITDESYEFELEPVQPGTLPREVSCSGDMVTYRVHSDTLRAAMVGGFAPVTIATGSGVHAHQLVRGSDGWGVVWRNAGENEVWGNRLDSSGPQWGAAGESLLAFVDFAGTAPLDACDGGQYGKFAAVASSYSIVVRPVDHASSASPREPSAVPRSVELSAYPNPFNGSVSLRWNSGRSGDGTIAIYDVLGRMVEEIDASGVAGEARWEPRVASGSYLAVFQSKRTGESASQRLLYLK